MTASTQAAARTAVGPHPAPLLRRDAAPFVVDLVSLNRLCRDQRAPESLLASLVTVSAAFCWFGTGTGAYFLIRPVAATWRARRPSPRIEHRISTCHAIRLSSSALLAPMVGLRLLSPQFDITFGAMPTSWPGPTSSPLRGLYRLQHRADLLRGQAPTSIACASTCSSRAASISDLPGRFRRKVGLCPDLRVVRCHAPAGRRHCNYGGPGWIREARSNVVSIADGGVIIYYWITRRANRPMDASTSACASGRERPLGGAAGTSDDEMGHAVSRFNCHGSKVCRTRITCG